MAVVHGIIGALDQSLLQGIKISEADKKKFEHTADVCFTEGVHICKLNYLLKHDPGEENKEKQWDQDEEVEAIPPGKDTVTSLSLNIGAQKKVKLPNLYTL